MHKLLTVLTVLNFRFFAEAAPVDGTSSVYSTIKLHSVKCPYLQTNVLKTEPEFLKPCTNFSRIESIAYLSDENINDVRCTIYYNSLVLLCATGNLRPDEIDTYFKKDNIEAGLKSNTIANVCQTFKNESRTIETIKESMKTILPALQSDETCPKICKDFMGHLYPACNEAAYMIQVIIKHNTGIQNGNKSSETPQPNATLTKQPDTSLPTKLQQPPAAQTEQAQQDKAQVQNSSKTPAKDNTPGFQIAPEQIRQQQHILKNKTEMQSKLVLNKTNETTKTPEGVQETNPAIPAPEVKKSDNITKVPENEEVQTGGLPGKRNEVETGGENKAPEKDKTTPDKDKIAPEKDKITLEEDKTTPEKDKIAPEKDKITAEKDKITPEKEKTTPEKEEPTPQKDKTTPEKSEPTAPGKNEPEKDSPVISEQDEPYNTVPESNEETEIGEDEVAKQEYTEFDDELKQPDEVKQPEMPKPPTEVNKQPEGKHKTPKPEETVDDDMLLASYNQHMDEDDSYFFSYFMMVCVVFVLAYVAYHNKQKVFALVLEGRRGRRTSRSRRPNSANYHKLDSNLEEAVSSACNKNTTHIIY